jgi:hypothetical protein
MSRSRVETSGDVVVQTQGMVGPGAVRYAQDKILAVVRKGGEPVLYARVKLARSADPAVSRPVLAQANLDVNGRQLRAHVAAATMREAVDLLQARLRERHARLARYREARRRGTATWAAEWHHAAELAEHPDFLHRPVSERTVVRRKSFALAQETPTDAAVEMEAMGYGFHLFIDAGTGQDSVIERTEPDGYRLTRMGSSAPRTSTGQVAGAVPAGFTVSIPAGFTVSQQPAPRLNEAEAVDRLELTGSRFVFFVNKDTGRGNILYHRYDGHYGLITPPV